MTDNEPATAIGGADTSTEDITALGEDTTAPETEAVEEFRSFNTELRYQYLECNLRIQQAKANDDVATEAVARRDRERVAQSFVAKNARLAQSAANPFMIKDRDLGAEHMQAALLGLWVAFAGTSPEAVDGVIVGDDGTLHPVGGWDPTKGTFATFAGSSISGQARRSVRRAEGAFTGMSYHTWGQKPKVDRARAELTAELGVTPTIAQIAAHAHLTEDTVRACSKSTPASLDAGVGDGSATLGDLIADTHSDDMDLQDRDPYVAEAELAKRAGELNAQDLMVLLLREGLVGPSRSVVQTADKLGIGRGSVFPALRRAQKLIDPPAVESDTPTKGQGELDESALELLELELEFLVE